MVRSLREQLEDRNDDGREFRAWPDDLQPYVSLSVVFHRYSSPEALASYGKPTSNGADQGSLRAELSRRYADEGNLRVDLLRLVYKNGLCHDGSRRKPPVAE